MWHYPKSYLTSVVCENNIIFLHTGCWERYIVQLPGFSWGLICPGWFGPKWDYYGYQNVASFVPHHVKPKFAPRAFLAHTGPLPLATPNFHFRVPPWGYTSIEFQALLWRSGVRDTIIRVSKIVLGRFLYSWLNNSSSEFPLIQK